MSYAIEQFKNNEVVIDFEDWTMAELRSLRKICRAIQPNRNEPRYNFGRAYFCEDGIWFEGGPHNLIGKPICRATDIVV